MHQVGASLAEGRHVQALEAVRRSRRPDPFLAIAESEALFGLLRYGEALGVATRALARRQADDDTGTRLRLIRAEALWHTGRVAPARSEARRAADRAVLPLTRARAFFTLGLFAWKDEQASAAWEHLSRARELYEAHALPSGLARTLGAEGGLAKDAGRLEEALHLQDRRLEFASRTPRVDAVAQARADRGAALTTLGRWGEARLELTRATELFEQIQDPRASTVARRLLAALELAAGELAHARALLARALEEEPAEGGDPRSRGETLLVLSDLRLAAGEPKEAEAAASEAVALFCLVSNPSGVCRSRVRRAQALLALGRAGEAIREARRAVQLAAAIRPSLEAMAQVALGRTLLRTLRAEAAFARALSLGAADPGLLRAARVGEALTRDRQSQAEVQAALGGLEAWGDRRLLAFAWADVRSVAGSVTVPAPLPPCPSPARGVPSEEAPAEGLAGIVGRSPVMRALFARLERAAAFDIDVHICGETGTGKEKVARALHQRSSRREGPFVAINASSLSDELLEAEMFGHAKGAFTGAVSARPGNVAAAEGGTLFLDEVTELSPRAQVKLLRFLQEREYRRLGETIVRRANVRLVSAANVDVEAEVAGGCFRRDLLYRLCAMKLSLPPLRERGDDVILLARHFLAAATKRAGLRPKALPADVASALRSHSWPGNVRELEHEISQLVVLAGHGPLRLEDVSPPVRTRPVRGSLREAERGFQRDHVRRALERHAGNRTRAAVELGLTRQGLLGMMKRLGL